MRPVWRIPLARDGGTCCMRCHRRTGVPLNPQSIKHHPMFVVVKGPKADWERA